MAQEVLESHDGLADAYQGMSADMRFQTAVSIMNNLEFQPLSEEQLKERIKLYFEIKPNPIIGAHHFSKASYECIKTYRSGFFIACTMMTHSINEGIIKFVTKRNDIERTPEENLPETIEKLTLEGLLSDESANASKAIWGSYRNAIHHMREDISNIEDWHGLAKQNLGHLEKVESCVFGFDFADGGTIRPHYPKHWDPAGDGLIKIWLRLE